MIEPDHGFLKPQQTVLLKVGEIPCICFLISCLFFLENARCNITILQKKLTFHVHYALQYFVFVDFILFMWSPIALRHGYRL